MIKVLKIFTVLLSTILIISCSDKHNNPKIETAIKADKKTKTVIENRQFYVGDINNDQIKDTAYTSIERNIENNDEIECGGKNCYIHIIFNGKIPPISLDQSLGVFIEKTEDLNNDNANEIILFSRTYEGWWNRISVWTFKNKKWDAIAETKAFISDDNDFKNRIIKENGNYYLIGQNQWELDENGDFKIIKVKIKK